MKINKPIEFFKKIKMKIFIYFYYSYEKMESIDKNWSIFFYQTHEDVYLFVYFSCRFQLNNLIRNFNSVQIF